MIKKSHSELFVFMENKPKREEINQEALERFGKRLREIRKAKGYKTAEAAAYKLEIQRAQYTRYESGKSNLNYLTMIEVLNKLDIPISEFFAQGFD